MIKVRYCLSLNASYTVNKITNKRNAMKKSKKQSFYSGILLGKYQVAMVTVSADKIIQTSWQQQSTESIFSGNCRILQDLISNIDRQQTKINIGLNNDLITYASLKIKSTLTKQEIAYYIKQTVRSTEYYYQYHLKNHRISIAAVKKTTLTKISKIFGKSKRSIQRIEPGIMALTQLLPPLDQEQAFLRQEQQNMVLYHIKNQDFLYCTTVNPNNSISDLVPNLTVWIDQKKIAIPTVLKNCLINNLTLLINYFYNL